MTWCQENVTEWIALPIGIVTEMAMPQHMCLLQRHSSEKALQIVLCKCCSYTCTTEILLMRCLTTTQTTVGGGYSAYVSPKLPCHRGKCIHAFDINYYIDTQDL